MNLVWDSQRLGTLDLGRKKLKRASHAYWKAACSLSAPEVVVAALYAAYKAARHNSETKTNAALKRMGR